MRTVLMVAMISGLTSNATGQTWPTQRPIKLVVPITAGSAVDVIARTVFDEVARNIGQTVVVENRPGAANTIGSAVVAKAEPDGYTLLANSSVHTIVPSTNPHLPYDAAKDLTPVIPLGSLPNVLVTPKGRFANLSAFAERAKSKADAVSYASIGVGSLTQLASERLGQSAGFKALPIAFSGSPEAIREVAAGRVDAYFSPLLPALGLIRDGQLDALAVSGARRSSMLPDVPTIEESGYPNSTVEFWVGVFATGGTPQPIIDRLHAEARKALQSPSVRDRLKKLGVEPFDMEQQAFVEYVRREIESTARLVKDAKILMK